MCTRDQIEQVRQANPILDVVSESVPLKGLKGLCPFHGDHNPSLSVSPQRGLVRCFVCMEHAMDVFAFVMKTQNMGFMEAVRHLAERKGIVLPDLTEDDKKRIKFQKRKEEILRIAADFYSAQLGDAPCGYLEKKGITLETRRRFKLGLAGNGGLREYLIQNGISEEEGVETGVLTVKSGRIEDFFKDAVVFPVMRRGRVISMTARCLSKDAPSKFLHIKGEIDFLYNEDILPDTDEVMICEGPIDTLTALQNGMAAVGVLGAQSFKDDYVAKFNGIEHVYGCLDADEAGFRGMKKLDEVFLGDIQIIRLPEGLDLTDYFATRSLDDFKDLKGKAKPLAEHELDDAKAEPVSFADIESPEYADRKIVANGMVCAKDQKCHAPEIFTAECSNRRCTFTQTCPFFLKKRKVRIPSNSRELLHFVNASDKTVQYTLRRAVPCPFGDPSRIKTKIVKPRQIQGLLVAPVFKKLRTVKEGDKELTIDEGGKEYVDKQVFSLVPITTNNEYFRMTGWVRTNPKTQVPTLIVTKLEPLMDDYQEFRLTNQIRESFKVLMPKDGRDLKAKIHEILEDLSTNVTEIYGTSRMRALLAILLTYHSIIDFRVGKRAIKRCCVEVVLVGDTGVGKTQAMERTRDHIDLGTIISATSATRTGIAYNWQTIGPAWYLKWGLYALSDGKFLYVDEGQSLSLEDWNKLSSGRSDGFMKAIGIKSGQHPTRVRFVVSCNPKDNSPIDEHMCGIATLKKIFRDADIRRFDIAVIQSATDEPASVVDQKPAERKKVPHKVTSQVLHDSVCWAWTRKRYQVVFAEGVEDVIHDVTKELKAKYEKAIDIPLVAADTRDKLTRLSVSVASFVHSTDETHEIIIVKSEHVLFIKDYLMELYDHENCSLNFYAALKGGETELTDEEYTKVLAAFIGEYTDSLEIPGGVTAAHIPNDIKTICLQFAENETVERSHLAEMLNVDNDTVTKKLKVFKDELDLLRGKSGKRGYRITPKFKKVLKRMMKDKLLGK